MESVKVKFGIPDPKHVSRHPGGHDCIQGGGHTKGIKVLVEAKGSEREC